MQLKKKTNRILALITLWFSTVACQSTSQLNQYPFYEPHQLTDASQFQSWWATVKTHQNQSDALSKCKNQPKICKGKLKSYGHVIHEAMKLSRKEQLELTHLYINRTPYDEDKVTRHYDHEGTQTKITRSSWKTLYDFLANGGDCEDFATAKYFMLTELGFDPSDLRIVIAYSRALFGYHAVLAVRQPDNSVWILDSEYPIKKSSHMGYRYIYAMNENTVWDHRRALISPEK